ncbi:MAG: ABC transporter permease [Bryobacteraceae bacterium]
MTDLRHSARVLMRSPGFTSVAVLALAIGIGANTAIFSVIDHVLLRPLPYPEPDRIFMVHRQYQSGMGESSSIPKFMAWKKCEAFQSMAAYGFGGVSLNLGSADASDPATAVSASSEFFDVFGVRPIVGRTYGAEEDLPGAAKVAVLTHGLWQSRFGGDRAIAGRIIHLNSEPHTVLGVLPEWFRPDPPADLYRPLQADPNSTNQGHYLLVAGRLKPGAAIESARSQLRAIGEQFRAAHPDTMDRTETAGATPLGEAIGMEVRRALLILGGAVSFVLLIACANVANLLLARAASRQRELAIRTAIGASRGRIIRQMLTESMLLAGAGGVAGLALGAAGIRALLALSPGNIPRINDPSHAATTVSMLDWRVLLFLVGVSLVTAILFGIVPAVQASRQQVNEFLKESGGRTGTGLRHNRIRGLLVISEFALAVILLVGAALMIRTFLGLRNVNPGFDPDNVLTLKTSLAGGRYDTTTAVDLMARLAIERLEALPGVEAAATATVLPIESGVDLTFTIDGQTPPRGGKWHGSEQWRHVSPRYFDVLRIPKLRGRVFDRRDTAKSAPVVVINEAFARRYWPKGDPVGSRITIGKGLGPVFEEGSREVVGVVGSVHEVGLNQGVQPVMYIPASQITDGLTKLANSVIAMSWLLRTRRDPAALRTPVERELLAVDTQLAPSQVRTMRGVMENSTARTNFNAALLTVFAGVALLLAVVGIYGVMSYMVEQRTQEIGIRVALGADSRRVLGLVLRQGALLTGTGIAIGVAAAFGLTRLLSRLLFGVQASDPAAFGVVVLLLAVVSLAAALVPALRAARMDPVIALRNE